MKRKRRRKRPRSLFAETRFKVKIHSNFKSSSRMGAVSERKLRYPSERSYKLQVSLVWLVLVLTGATLEANSCQMPAEPLNWNPTDQFVQLANLTEFESMLMKPTSGVESERGLQKRPVVESGPNEINGRKGRVSPDVRDERRPRRQRGSEKQLEIELEGHHQADDWRQLGRGLRPGSRVLVAAENQTVELTCDTAATSAELLTAADNIQRRRSTAPTRASGDDDDENGPCELVVADSNGTLVPLTSERSIMLENGHLQQVANNLQPPPPAAATRLKDEEPADHLVSLVFWYKDDNPAPIYTLDARQSMLEAVAGARPGAQIAFGQVDQMNARLLANAKHYQQKPQQRRQIRDRLRIKTDEWPVVKLELARVGPEEQGDYKCRVDFWRARTIRRVARLFVDVPLQQLELTATTSLPGRAEMGHDQDGQSGQSTMRTVQLDEGQSVEFGCSVRKGSPRPKLTWLLRRSPRENSSTSFLDETQLGRLGGGQIRHLLPAGQLTPSGRGAVTETMAAELGNRTDQFGTVSSRLQLSKLDRSLDGAQIGCLARQSGAVAKWRRNYANSTAQSQETNSVGVNELELSKWFELSLNLKPEVVELTRWPPSPADTTSANNGTETERTGGQMDEFEPVSFHCQSRGSKPPARLDWFWLRPDSAGASNEKREQLVQGAAGWTIADKLEGQLSESTLSRAGGFDRAHSKWRLVCEAKNERIPNAILSAQVELDVRFKPTVRLVEQPEQTTSKSSERRQFECRVDSNPSINQLVWLVNKRPLFRLRLKQSARIKTRPERTSKPNEEEEKVGAKFSLEPAPDELINGKRDLERNLEKVYEDGHLIELFDQAEIKQFHLAPTGPKDNKSATLFELPVAVGPSKFEISRHKKRFLIDLSRFGGVDHGGEGDGGGVVGPGNGRDSVVIRLTAEPAAELEAGSKEDLAQIECVAWNELGTGSSEWVNAQEAQIKCLVDENVRNESASEHSEDSLLSRLRVHQVRRTGEQLLCRLNTRPEVAATGKSGTEAPRRFTWSFMALDQVPRQLASLLDETAPTSGVEFESESAELSELDAGRLIPSNARGLVSCRAQFPDGRSGPVCLTLVAGGVIQNRDGDKVKVTADVASWPSAQNCRLEPILEGEPQGGRLALSVDCSATPNKEKLIFELAVSPLSSARSREDSGRRLDDLMLLDEQRPTKPTMINTDTNQPGGGRAAAGKKLLFVETSPAELNAIQHQQRRQSTANGTGNSNEQQTTKAARRFVLTDLISGQNFPPSEAEQANSTRLAAQFGTGDQMHLVHGHSDGSLRQASGRHKSTKRKGLDSEQLQPGQQFAGAQVHHGDHLQPGGNKQIQQRQREKSFGQGERLMTLAEQVELLNEFVFTLRASDLVCVSEPRAIYGADLKLAKRQVAIADLERQAALLSKGEPQTRQLAGKQTPSVEVTAQTTFATNLTATIPIGPINGPLRPLEGSLTSGLLHWGRNHEILITMAAIGATLVLSALTLALIVVVLRNRAKVPASSTTVSSNPNRSDLILMPTKSASDNSNFTLLESANKIEDNLSQTIGRSFKNESLVQLPGELKPFAAAAAGLSGDLARWYGGNGGGGSFAGSLTRDSQQVDFLAPPISAGGGKLRQVRINVPDEGRDCPEHDGNETRAYFGATYSNVSHLFESPPPPQSSSTNRTSEHSNSKFAQLNQTNTITTVTNTTNCSSLDNSQMQHSSSLMSLSGDQNHPNHSNHHHHHHHHHHLGHYHHGFEHLEQHPEQQQHFELGHRPKQKIGHHEPQLIGEPMESHWNSPATLYVLAPAGPLDAAATVSFESMSSISSS